MGAELSRCVEDGAAPCCVEDAAKPPAVKDAAIPPPPPDRYEQRKFGRSPPQGNASTPSRRQLASDPPLDDAGEWASLHALDMVVSHGPPLSPAARAAKESADARESKRTGGGAKRDEAGGFVYDMRRAPFGGPAEDVREAKEEPPSGRGADGDSGASDKQPAGSVVEVKVLSYKFNCRVHARRRRPRAIAALRRIVSLKVSSRVRAVAPRHATTFDTPRRARARVRAPDDTAL